MKPLLNDFGAIHEIKITDYLDFGVLFTVSLYCSTLDRHAMDTELAVQHDSLAKHFADEASEMLLKVDEHKKFLNHFESQRYVYGRHADDLKAHSQQIIRIYEQAVAANREMARLIEENGH